MCNEFIVNANVEDFTHWLHCENPNDPKLSNRIESCYSKLNVHLKYAHHKLSKKQELVHRIIMNWIKDRIGK